MTKRIHACSVFHYEYEWELLANARKLEKITFRPLVRDIMIGNHQSPGEMLPSPHLVEIVGARPQHTKGKRLPLSEMAKILCASIRPGCRLLYERGIFRELPRLSREGIHPILHFIIESTNTAVINRWLDAGTKVGFLCSFPRSGNTWMRYMLCDIICQTQGIETTTDLPMDPDDLISVLNCSSIVRRIGRCPRWAFLPQLAFVKSHTTFPRMEQFLSRPGIHNAGRKPFRDSKVICLFRSPEDALVSLYHLKVRDDYRWSRASLNIDAFCLKVLAGWIEIISSYLRAAQRGFPIAFISYEQTLKNPGAVLGNLLNWMDVKHDRRMVERAVSNMRFSNLQAMEKNATKANDPIDENALFFRRGRPGSGQSDLQKSTLREIHDRTAALIQEANDRQMKQASEFSAEHRETPTAQNGKVLGTILPGYLKST